MDYCRRLYNLRTDHDLTQEQVAQILNTSKQTYGRYENGTRKLSIEDLIKLAQYYNVTTDYILGLSNDINSQSQIKTQNIRQINIGNNSINIQ